MKIDVLADILEVGQLGSKVICQADLPEPWGLNFDIETRAMCHIVTRGSCWFIPYADAEPIKLAQGDIAFMPSCKGHRLLSSVNVKGNHYQTELREKNCRLKPRSVYPNNETSLFCCHYILEGDISLPFFSLFPAFIHLNADSICSEPNLQKLVSMIMFEESSNNLGSELILSRLIDLLLIYIIRVFIKNEENFKVSWMYALKDVKIGTAISLMHNTPAKKWTVESLARELAMSRAAFAKRFSALTGASPLSYLTSWRMDLSAKLLRRSKLSIGEIARQVGYDSEPSFSKAFKKHRHVPPGVYRSKLVDAIHDVEDIKLISC